VGRGGVVKGRDDLADFGERFKRLKNLIERSVVFRRDGGKRDRRNCGLWRVYKVGE